MATVYVGQTKSKEQSPVAGLASHSANGKTASRLKELCKIDVLVSEKWWDVWIGLTCFVLIIVVSLAETPESKPLPQIWESDFSSAWNHDNIPGFIIICIVSIFLYVLGFFVVSSAKSIKAGEPLTSKTVKQMLMGFPIVVIGAMFAQWLGAQKEMRKFGFGYAVWSIILGMLFSNTICRKGLPEFLKTACHGEFCIKIGLVLLGIDLQTVASLGAPGLVVGWVVTPVAITFMYMMATRVVKLESSTFAIVLSCGTCVCGASAATAVAGAIAAPKEELTLAIALITIFTTFQILLVPYIGMGLGIQKQVIGAWLGGSIDATGAVVASADILDDERALETASTVKIVQNALIGIVAVVVTIIWLENSQGGDMESTNVNAEDVGKFAKVKVYLKQVWMKFPKFILGFLLVSVLLTAFKETTNNDKYASMKMLTKSMSQWWFTLGFTSIGIETVLQQMVAKMEGTKPLFAYCIGQLFDLLMTLLFAWIAFDLMES